MKQRLWVMFAAVIMAATSVQGLDLDVVTSFNGNGGPSGKFYYPIYGNTELIAGFSATLPARKYSGNNTGQELDTDILLGMTANVPLLNQVDVYFLFDNYDGTNRTGAHEKSDFYTQSLTVSKKWLYGLNDQVKVGVEAVLGEVMLDGSKEINVLQSISPVLGVTISIL